jgi:hypothetical protein
MRRSLASDMGRLSLLEASLGMRGSTQNITPQLLQSAGGQGDVILEREARELRNKANEHSGVHEEGIL